MGSLKELIRKVQNDLAGYFVDLTVPRVSSMLSPAIEDDSEHGGTLVPADG